MALVWNVKHEENRCACLWLWDLKHGEFESIVKWLIDRNFVSITSLCLCYSCSNAAKGRRCNRSKTCPISVSICGFIYICMSLGWRNKRITYWTNGWWLVGWLVLSVAIKRRGFISLIAPLFFHLRKTNLNMWLLRLWVVATEQNDGSGSSMYQVGSNENDKMTGHRRMIAPEVRIITYRTSNSML